MREEKLASILQPFAQGEGVYNRRREGLGLGLTIARRLLNDQGAELFIVSREDIGTEVKIVFGPQVACSPAQACADSNA